MAEPEARGVSRLRSWSGLAEPSPSRRRLVSAGVAAGLTVLLTVFGSRPEELGAGFGRLFIVFAIVVGPLVAGLLVLRPWNGIVAWAAMMALLNVARLQWWIGPVQITQSTLFVGALVAGTVFDRERLFAPRAAVIVAIGLCATAAASLLASPSSIGLTIVQHGALEPVLVGLLVVAARPSARQLAALGGGLVVGLALASVYSVVRIGRVATTIAGLEAVRVQLAHFTFYNVGIYGDVLAMTIPIGLAILLSWRAFGLRRTHLALIVGCVGALFAGLYLTFSKSAWLGVWLATIVVLAVRFRQPRQIAAITLGALVVLAMIVPYPLYVLRALHLDSGGSNAYVQLISRVQGGRLSSWDVGSPDGEVSITERWLATIAAGRMIVDHPLLGVGPGQFAAEYAGRYADPAAKIKLGSPHNLLPDVASEFGLVAALLLVLALAGAAWSAWKAIRAPDRLHRALGGAFGAALLAFISVTATFGLDLYRDYRVMNSDVIIAGLIVGACVALGPAMRDRVPESPAT